nr:POTRA domain, FtsQ-type [uncultured bacterium]
MAHDEHHQPIPNSEELPEPLNSASHPQADGVEIPIMASVHLDGSMAQPLDDSDLPDDDEEQTAVPTGTRRRTPIQQEKARRRQSVFLKRRREMKKRKILFQRVRVVIKVLLSVLLVIGLFFAFSSPLWRFSAERITINGNKAVAPQLIEPVLAAYDGQPIYAINPRQIEAKLKHSLSLVERVYVRRYLYPAPGLDITIAEKPVWGLLYSKPPVRTEPFLTSKPAHSAETVLMVEQNQKKVTPLESFKDPKAAPPVKPMFLLHWDGTSSDLAQFELSDKDLLRLGPLIPIVSKQTYMKPARLKKIQAVAQYLNSRPRHAKLDYLDVTNPYDIVAQFNGFQVRVGQLDTTVTQRLERLFHIVPQIRDFQDQIEFVDLRWNHQVTFRKKATKATSATKMPTN